MQRRLNILVKNMNILLWMGNKKLHPAIYPNMKSIADALVQLGHNVITCDTSQADEVMAAISLLREEKMVDLSIGFNALGMRIIIDGEPLDVYADLDVLHISILLDEPFNPACNGYKHEAKRHLITYLDRTDAYYLTQMQLVEHKAKMFMPLGGTESGLLWEELLERKKNSSYNVVVSAGKFDLHQRRPVWPEYGLAPAMCKMLDDIVSMLQEYPVSVVEAVRCVLHERGMEDDCYFSAIAGFFPLILCYVKSWRRQHLIESLAMEGVEIDLFGSGWEPDDFQGKVNIHGVVPYADMLDVITKAKVVVNDEACFNHGAHDWVFTSMLNGAVVVSEYSAYLAEEFVDGQDLFLFDWQNIREQLNVIPRLLNDDSYWEKVAARAYKKASDKHTWRHRAMRLLEAADLLDFQYKIETGKIHINDDGCVEWNPSS